MDFCIFVFWFTPKALQNQKSKIQNLSEGPETFVFLVFLGFWFSNRNQKKHRVVLVFHQRPNKKITKNPVLFGFPPKIQKNHVFFWISVGKPKNPRKTKKSKSFGPLRKILDFRNFVFFWFPPS